MSSPRRSRMITSILLEKSQRQRRTRSEQKRAQTQQRDPCEHVAIVAELFHCSCSFQNLRDICLSFATSWLEDLVYQTEVNMHKLFGQLQRYLNSESVSVPAKEEGGNAKRTRDPFGKLVRSVFRALVSESERATSGAASSRSNVDVSEDTRIVESLAQLQSKLSRWNDMLVMERMARDLSTFLDVDDSHTPTPSASSAAAAGSAAGAASKLFRGRAAPSADGETEFTESINPLGDGHCFFRALRFEAHT